MYCKLPESLQVLALFLTLLCGGVLAAAPPVRTVPPPIEEAAKSGFAQAELLLKKTDAKLEYVKLKLKPEVLADLGARDFHAFGSRVPRLLARGRLLLLYVFEYETAGAAAENLEKLRKRVKRDELMYHFELVRNGKLVLAAGCGGEKKPSEAATGRLQEFMDAFKPAGKE